MNRPRPILTCYCGVPYTAPQLRELPRADGCTEGSSLARDMHRCPCGQVLYVDHRDGYALRAEPCPEYAAIRQATALVAAMDAVAGYDKAVRAGSPAAALVARKACDFRLAMLAGWREKTLAEARKE